MLHYFPSMNQHPSETFERQNQLHDVQTLDYIVEFSILYEEKKPRQEQLFGDYFSAVAPNC